MLSPEAHSSDVTNVKKVRDCTKIPEICHSMIRTKWAYNYEMLLAASELKEEFSRLDCPDYFKSPSGEDWNLIFGDEAASYINIVDEGIHQLFLDYAVGDVTGYLSNGDGHGLGHTYFDDFIMESASQQSKSELDQYLEESLLPRSHEFDVMRWWKLNEPKYPQYLTKMARDILTLPVSTVDPESVFDTGVKEMDRYRCALKPETVEALYCAKDWLRTESIESMDSLVKMEFQI
ncbi:zinc finger BED domain-containing protein DAYSLEEPER-like protein [Tanacetum coccineum]